MNVTSKKMITTSFIYAAGQILIQVINFMLLPVYTKKLGTIEYGEISTITACSGFIGSFFMISIYSGLCRFYNDAEDKDKITSTALNFAYLVSILMVVLMCFFGEPISKIFFNFGDSYKMLWIIIITLIVNQIYNIYSSKYSMEFKAIKVCSIEVSKIVIQFIIIIYLVVYKNSGLMGVLYGQLISATIIFIFVTIYEIKRYKFVIDNEMLKNMLIFSLGILPVNVSGWILTLSDRYFIKYFKGVADTGIYNLGYQFGMLINPLFIVPFLSSFTAYKFAAYKEANSKENFKNLFRKYTSIGCFIMLGIALYCKLGIVIFASRDFINAYKVVPLVLYSYFLYGQTGYYVLGLQIKNKTYKIGIYMIYASVINLIMNFILVPKFGIMGAAMATIISYIILNFIFIKSSNKYYSIDLDFKYQFCVQFIALIIYVAYYFISFSNISLFQEFCINIFLLILYVYILAKLKFIQQKFIYNSILDFVKRKKEGLKNAS